MRPAGKKRIAIAMAEFARWRSVIDPRIESLANADARKYLTEWRDDLAARILEGNLGPCTFALSSSILRDVEAWEEGYFSHVDATGGRHHARKAGA